MINIKYELELENIKKIKLKVIFFILPVDAGDIANVRGLSIEP